MLNLKKIKSEQGGVTLLEIIVSLVIIVIIAVSIFGQLYYSSTQLYNEEIAKRANQELCSFTEQLNSRLRNDIISAQEMMGIRRPIEVVLDKQRNIKGEITYERIIEINVPETTDRIDYYEFITKIEWKDLFGRKREIELELVQTLI